MTDLFLGIINMSIASSWIVLVVLLLRLLLKKAPKWITVLLWGIVAVRLICPFSIESVMSLIPSAETVSPEIMTESYPSIHSGVYVINSTLNPIISESFAPAPGASANPLQIILPIISIIWLVGVAVMLAYTVISYLRLKRKIGTAVLLIDNIFQSENVVSPFVLGIFKPKIYLPFTLDEQSSEHVIAHEKAHIRRKDHLWKPLGFLILTIHWFNPFVWLGYVLLCRDIELACDEKVVRELDCEQKADYSAALLSCSVNRRIISACPLAFGEVGVKNRVKSVLNYKKPAFWIIVVAVIASIVTAVCFLTSPRTSLDDELAVFLDMRISEHHYSKEHTDDNFIAISQKVLDVDKSSNKTTVYLWVLYHEYSFKNGEIKLETGSHIPTVITVKSTKPHGHYELIEYWEPRDGSYYASDIKEKFPWHLHSKALDSQRYITEQIAFCDNAAKEYFSSNVLIDSASFDIDGDGKDEQCHLSPGPTSGLFSFVLSAYENGQLEYHNTFIGISSDKISFATTDDGMKLRIEGQEEHEAKYYSFVIKDGNVVLSANGEDVDYWGAQVYYPQVNPEGTQESETIGTDDPSIGTVTVTETVSDLKESSYRISAYLPATDFSSIGKELKDEIDCEWERYHSLSEIELSVSSKLWGFVSIHTDTWSECENAIGFDIHNPLESLDILRKTGYFGKDGSDPSDPIPHIMASAYMLSPDNSKALNQINVVAGYVNDGITVTLTATLRADTNALLTTGHVKQGYATFEQKNTSTASGIPVLVVSAHESNNTGYYVRDFFDPTAYFIKDNVFYSLRVYGDEADKDKISDTLDKILEEF